MTSTVDVAQTPPKKSKIRYLYIAVIVAAVAGIIVGAVDPALGKDMKWLGTLFVNLVKMMIAPVIFCTVVLGIGSLRSAARVGKIGGLAIGYFMVMSTFALAIGLVVGNVVKPGDGLKLTAAVSEAGQKQAAAGAKGPTDFVLSIIPETMVSALTSGVILQTLLVALLVGFALQTMGKKGEPIVVGLKHIETLVFRVMAMVMWLAPVGAFGGLAAVVGSNGLKALNSLLWLMGAFYLTCLVFVFCILAPLLWFVARVNVFKFFRYLAAEFLLILSTSSSESALPRVIAKLEHAGIQRSTVGITIPTGYSFNLDGTAIYLTMTSLFIAEALQQPFSISEQIGLLFFMMLASKGAAGVTGAGLATLAAGLSAHKPVLLDGVGFVVGIDRFMSEARALTNFAGNSIATVLVAQWTKTWDREQMAAVLNGHDPFDEDSMDPDEHHYDDPAHVPHAVADVRDTRAPLTERASR